MNSKRDGTSGSEGVGAEDVFVELLRQIIDRLDRQEEKLDQLLETVAELREEQERQAHALEENTARIDRLADAQFETANATRQLVEVATIEWGSSIRTSIDEGLAGSYFGLAVFSPDFFAKSWTSYELDGLLERAASGEGRLLPLWHRLSKDDVMRYAPSLANRAALNTSLSSADDIVTELVKLRDRYRAVAMVPDEIEDPS